MKVLLLLVGIFFSVSAKKSRCNEGGLYSCLRHHNCECPDSSRRAYKAAWDTMPLHAREYYLEKINEPGICPNVTVNFTGLTTLELFDIFCDFPKEVMVQCVCDVNAIGERYIIEKSLTPKDEEFVVLANAMRKMTVPLTTCKSLNIDKCIY